MEIFNLLKYLLRLCLTSFLFKYSNAQKMWDNFMETAMLGTSEISDLLKPYIVENFPTANVSEPCLRSLIRYAKGVNNFEPWAIKMFDATGKPPSSFLRGTYTDFGNFEECLSLEIERTPSNWNYSDSFKGQFCMLSLTSPLFPPNNIGSEAIKSYVKNHGIPPQWVRETTLILDYDYAQYLGLHLGICIPSTCSERDLSNIFLAYAKPIEIQVSLSDCQINEPRKWTTNEKIAVFAVTCMIILIIIGTAFDVFERKMKQSDVIRFNKGNKREILKAFSVCSNLEILFEVKKTSSSLDFIVGMKFWIVIWMLFLHLLIYETVWQQKKFRNGLHITRNLDGTSIMLDNSLMNTTYLIFLNGFLTTYILRNKNSKLNYTERKNSLLKSILIKYLRVLPEVVFLMLMTFAIPLAYNGPVWNSTWDSYQDKCLKNGWANLLLANNFYDYGEHCWIHTWFRTTLVHFNVICLPLLYLAKRNPKISILLGSLMIIGCGVRDFLVSYQNKFLFPVLCSSKSLELNLVFGSKIYLKPFQHFPPYAIGLLFGWINLKDFKMKKLSLNLCWGFYVLFSLALYYVVWYPTENIILTSFHNAFRNVFFSLQMGWLMYTCLNGTAGFIGKIFSWKALLPLNKVLGPVAFFHPILIISYEAMRRERFYMSRVKYIQLFLAMVVYSFLIGVIGFVMVESPFNRLLDIWEGRTSLAPQKNTEISKSNESVTENDKRKEDGKEFAIKKNT